jgi:hypothetical protein
MIFVISLVRKLRIVWKNTKRKDARIQILLVSRSNTCILVSTSLFLLQFKPTLIRFTHPPSLYSFYILLNFILVLNIVEILIDDFKQ